MLFKRIFQKSHNMPSLVFITKLKANNVKDILIDVSCFFVFLLILIVFLPAEVYYKNVTEYSYYFYEYLIPVIFLIIILVAIYTCLLLFVSEHLRVAISVLLASISFLLIIQSNFLDWNYGMGALLDGGTIKWQGHTWQGIVDTLLWSGVLLSVFIFRRVFYAKYLKNTILFLLLFQLLWVSYISLSYNFSEKSKNDYLKAYYPDETTKFSFSQKENIVIILLDTYRSDIFYEIINEDSFYRAIFKDFTYYRNNISGYPFTDPSIPFSMTGKFYDNSIPLKEYIQKEYTANSLPKTFLTRGYDVTLPFKRTIYTSSTISNNFVKKTFNVKRMITIAKNEKIIDLVLFKSLPSFLKPIFLGDVQYKNYDLDFLDCFKKQFKCDNKKKTFKFFHLNGAHVPNVIDEDLSYKPMPLNRDSYKKQAKASLKICQHVFEHMKKHSIYDDSLIIVMSDHGVAYPKMINVLNGKEVDSSFIKLSLALMLVKKRQSKQKNLQITDEPTTNGDLSKIIMEESFSAVPDMRKFYYYVHPFSAYYLLPMTEYRVTGHAWDEKSWQPTGKVFTKPRTD